MLMAGHQAEFVKAHFGGVTFRSCYLITKEWHKELLIMDAPVSSSWIHGMVSLFVQACQSSSPLSRISTLLLSRSVNYLIYMISFIYHYLKRHMSSSFSFQTSYIQWSCRKTQIHGCTFGDLISLPQNVPSSFWNKASSSSVLMVMEILLSEQKEIFLLVVAQG